MSYLGDVLHLALPVKPISESVDDTKPPATAEEYLQRVVLEAAHCEDVTVANVDRNRFASKRTPVFQNIGCAQAPAHLTPSIEWQQKQVYDFSVVRRKLAQMKSVSVPACDVELPHRDDEKGWLTYCFGNEEQVLHSEKDEITSHESKQANGKPPLVSTILSMNQPTVEQLLDYHISWLQGATHLTDQQGRWLYALLVALELPLTPDTCFLLRTLARECARLRAVAAEVDCQPEIVSPLNLLICLVALYFRQGDLADA